MTKTTSVHTEPLGLSSLALPLCILTGTMFYIQVHRTFVLGSHPVLAPP